ncbi:hypothetical protein ACET3Z_004063 [Daucus carota]
MSTTPNTTYHSETRHGHSDPYITIVLAITLLIFFVLGFFSIYFCRCFLHRVAHSWRLRHNPAATSVGPANAATGKGLDPAIIKAFPSFMYSTVKEYRREKYGLECAICLCEFQDDDFLRLLTSCCHVFHQDCIDLWLESHTSCPVCRRTLEAPAPAMYKASPDVVSIQMNEDASSEHSVVITIDDDDHDHDHDHDHEAQEEGEIQNESARRSVAFAEPVENQETAPSTSGTAQNQEVGHDQAGEEIEVEKFSRSKTTGHSIVKKKDTGDNKFTLILPEHVTAKLIRGHSMTRSETAFGEFRSKTTTGKGGFGEVSELSRWSVRRQFSGRQ